ncbi:MAG: ABC transporter ATP-binding protein [Rhodospirillaceae bacterium]|nr:MAG: ABC transporter ATP-binding protein [Rhodospirillaceae bacterium]
MSADVELDHVTIAFGNFIAVNDASLKINNGEFFSFLGPSGCGKTTILRTVSGFLEPTKGAVRIGGRDMSGIGPNKRPTALIFQNLALFPLMTVAENIAYGLRVRGMGRTERRRKAEHLLNMIALSDQGGKMVAELSGGQKQRVAIARALAVEPQVLLLDEPLSALDLKLRQHMRNELRAIQQRVGITFIYITHDQGEALTMSDRIAVMNEGVIQQVGDAKSIYDRPATSFVASFVGENNSLIGKVVQVDGAYAQIKTQMGNVTGRNLQDIRIGESAVAFIRPEKLTQHAAANQNRLQTTVKSIAFEGNLSHVYLVGPGHRHLTMTVGRETPLPEAGADIGLHAAIDDTLILPMGKLASGETGQ